MLYARFGRTATSKTVQNSRRSFHFASPEYVRAIQTPPEVDRERLKQDTLRHIEAESGSRRWFGDPICTLLNGTGLCNGQAVSSRDAFGIENGSQLLATRQEIDDVLAHLESYSADAPWDPELCRKVREIEDELMTKYAGALIGDQALDFHKQDGVTEIEEAIQANMVERRLNDALLAAETRSEVRVSRSVAFVGCVSNFGNFLDLCRKTLRNLEANVPVLVLSRSNTTQHNFRWAQILLHEMREKQMDLGLLTYLSATIEEQQRVMNALAANSPFYITGSRQIAEKVKAIMPMTFSSTGGPNTMVAPEIDDNVARAAKMSIAIENGGQCTAMRHLFTDNMSKERIEQIFDGLQTVDSPQDALSKDVFDAVFPTWATTFRAEPGYGRLKDKPVAFRVSQTLPDGIQENWRRLYLDVTTSSTGGVRDEANLRELSSWLAKEQPITLAVNGDDDSFSMSKFLFENTAHVVYSVGRGEEAALTCQARPQDGEIFGEFPPRGEMHRYSVFPVFVPSATPGYVATYRCEHLLDAASGVDEFSGGLRLLLDRIEEQALKGYGVLLLRYLKESCGPKEGIGARSTLWGLQRPPLWDVHTIFRIECDDKDIVALQLLPFVATNAKTGFEISFQRALEGADVLMELCDLLSIPFKTEDNAEFKSRCADVQPWNVLRICAYSASEEFPTVSHFVSLTLPMGHIKSVLSDDQLFLDTFRASDKWLRFEEH